MEARAPNCAHAPHLFKSILSGNIKPEHPGKNFFFFAICRLQRFQQTVTLDSDRGYCGFAPQMVHGIIAPRSPKARDRGRPR
jgi:hypothetical protein